VNLIFGTVIDDEMGDEVKITVVAAGFDRVDSISGVESATTSGASRLSELFTDDESEDEEDDGFDVPSFLK
ncbi:MAG: cell division protein FtsZ, partial [Actinomycetota bacterium]|nr:cell division protein FtsZ [Actinomycetota bacterium]